MAADRYLTKDFFAADTLEVAESLLGTILSYRGCRGRIVEVEAYKADAASHAVTKPRQGALLRETYGLIYIFLAYGVHYCLNFTTERSGTGAVLIRAVEPLSNLEAMRRRRGVRDLRQLTSGPGKLFRAFGLTPELHGEEVGKRVRIERPDPMPEFVVARGPRIGLSRAQDLPWRFYIQGHPFVSR